MKAPNLSVIVPSVNGWNDLRDCLTALSDSAEELLIEVIVVDRVGDAVRRRLQEEFREVTTLEVAPDTPIPQMRALAIARATAPLVAVIEDHVLVPPGWGRAMVSAQRRFGGVVGGAVENAATDRPADWAAFLCEYGRVLPPLTEGPAEWLTGNNTIYPRALLEARRDLVRAGRWEDYLHSELRRAGTPLVCCPNIVVAHKRHATLGAHLAQRYWYARSYAGSRATGWPWTRRAWFGLLALFLPPVLFARTVRSVWAKRRHRRELLQALPLLVGFACVSAAGDVLGSWRGSGPAFSRVC